MRTSISLQKTATFDVLISKFKSFGSERGYLISDVSYLLVEWKSIFKIKFNKLFINVSYISNYLSGSISAVFYVNS